MAPRLNTFFCFGFLSPLIKRPKNLTDQNTRFPPPPFKQKSLTNGEVHMKDTITLVISLIYAGIISLKKEVLFGCHE